MYKELRGKAEKRVKSRMGFYVCVILFSIAIVVLLMLSFYMPSIGFWLRFPIPIIVMVLCLIYISVFGLSSKGELSEDWQEDEIEKEMLKLLRQKKAKLATQEELSESEILELKELKLQEQRQDLNEDFV